MPAVPSLFSASCTRLALLFLVVGVGCTAMTTNSRLPVQVSDDAYENVNFLPLISSNASRITYVFTTDIVSSDPCQAFHDIEFMIDDNGIKRFAEVTVTKIASLMKLIPSPNWQFRPYPDS